MFCLEVTVIKGNPIILWACKSVWVRSWISILSIFALSAGHILKQEDIQTNKLSEDWGAFATNLQFAPAYMVSYQHIIRYDRLFKFEVVHLCQAYVEWRRSSTYWLPWLFSVDRSPITSGCVSVIVYTHLLGRNSDLLSLTSWPKGNWELCSERSNIQENYT